jgi:hypothetical protein
MPRLHLKALCLEYMCTFKLSFREYSQGHLSHFHGLSWPWTFLICRFKSLFSKNRSKQCSQRLSLIPSWTRWTCLFNWLLFGNEIPQPSYLHSTIIFFSNLKTDFLHKWNFLNDKGIFRFWKMCLSLLLFYQNAIHRIGQPTLINYLNCLFRITSIT